MPTTCGDDCRAISYEVVYQDEQADALEARWTNGAAYYMRNRGTSDCCTFGYCVECGRRVGFTADGAPAVGERYDVLERKLEEAERALVPLKRLWDAMTPFARAKALGDCEGDPLAGLTYQLANSQE